MDKLANAYNIGQVDKSDPPDVSGKRSSEIDTLN